MGVFALLPGPKTLVPSNMTTPQILVVSHQLGATPLGVVQVVAPGYENILATELLAEGPGGVGGTTNDSQFIALIYVTDTTKYGQRDLDGIYVAWDISRFTIT